MDFGQLLTRSWEIIWNNKFLILLGILIALGSGNGGTSSSISNSFDSSNQADGEFNPEDFNFEDFDFSEQQIEEVAPFLAPILGLGVGILFALICLLFMVGIVLWIVSIIARGALIAGVDMIEKGEETTFGTAWQAGWKKGWRLFGIGLVQAVPVIIFLIVIGVLVFGFAISADATGEPAESAIVGFIVALCSVICVFGLLMLFIGFLRMLADRAAMLEDTTVFESYGRAWEVLRTNLGQVIILGLIHLGISIGIGMVMLVPSIFIAICCFLWPLMWVINGTIEAYFSTLWTLAWRSLTGRDEEMNIDPEPALG